MSPSSGDLQLTEKEREILLRFRRRVSEWLPSYYDDFFLMRWLRARNWQLDAADHMLVEHMRWRKNWKVDDLESWKPPEVLVKYYPVGVSGFDKEGSPVVIVPFAGLDIVGLIHSASRGDFIRVTIKHLEKFLKLAEKQSEKYGPKARKLTVIMDMEGFVLKPYTWRPAAELVVTLVKMYEANYPETLKIAFIINAPVIFSVGFAIIKTFLHEHTLGKIHIYKNDQAKWLPQVVGKIDESQLPVQFGGQMIDPDGDPRCPSKICQGGKVPKSYYLDKSAPDEAEIIDKKPYVVVHVKKGEKLCLDFELTKPGSILKWEFHTESHDIKFGISRLTTEGTEIEEVPLKRVKCSHHDEIGVITTNTKAKYRVTFDNTYSYLRSKKLYYLIQILPPFVS